MKLSPILVKLADSQSAFLSAADRIPTEHWNKRPQAEQWSAGEIVAHLITVERSIVSAADRMVQKEPRGIPFWKRVHVPLRLVELRWGRLKTPIESDPALMTSKEEMLGELRLTRERTLAFLAETQNRDLSGYGWRHVFLGRLNMYEWFRLIAAHQLRHTKQMREVESAVLLPKVVENSQN
jgi:DinB superfamily